MDQEVVDKHLQDLAAMVAHLRSYHQLTQTELEANTTHLLALQHALQRAIQNLLDVAMHVLASQGINDWEDYRGAIIKLGDIGIMPAPFAGRISGMAHVRNILVHAYTEMEMDILWDLVQNRLDDFDQFSRYIIDSIEKE
jgi:uncharacterized protein YutE (UPF0331/DUF86 family)